jgi:hypothetical protein
MLNELSKKDDYYTYIADNGEVLNVSHSSSMIGFLFANILDYKHFMKYMMQTDLPIPVIMLIPNQETSGSETETGNKH